MFVKKIEKHYSFIEKTKKKQENMSGSMQIDKLNGDNYSSWSIQMKSLLITLDYWSVCETICPSTASPDDKSRFKALDEKALATITLSVKPSELIHVKNI